MVIAHFIKLQLNYGTIFPCMSKVVELYPYLSLLSRHTYSKLVLMIKFNCWLITVAHMLLFAFYVVYIVIVCIVFLALRDFGGRHFISTVLLLLLLLFAFLASDCCAIICHYQVYRITLPCLEPRSNRSLHKINRTLVCDNRRWIQSLQT